MMERLLEVESLSVTLPTPQGLLQAVTDVSFTVHAGETLGLVGESGCGKSMTALALLGLQPRRATRTARRLALEGQDLMPLSDTAMNRLRGDRIAMIFQEPMTSLNPVFTVGDQLTSVYRQHRRVSAAEARERAIYLLDRVRVTAPASRLRQYPHELSGGLRQRVMIAMALMCGPRLMIADEPTTALDVTIQCELLRLLDELRHEFGMAIIIISHDLGIVSRLADRVAVMYAGEIVEHGAVEQVFDAPSHYYTRGLLGCLPECTLADRQGRLPSIPGTIPTPIGERAGCGFRDRCAGAVAACAEGHIALRPIGPDHEFRCIMPPESLPPFARAEAN